MRAVVQRVAWAKVEVDGDVVGAIERGLLVYLGAGKGDGDAERAYVLSKVLGLRIFENDAGKMDLSVVDIGGALLVVSQFTLYGDVRRGRRPSFDGAMPPEEAERAYEAFVAEARAQGIRGGDREIPRGHEGVELERRPVSPSGSTARNPRAWWSERQRRQGEQAGVRSATRATSCAKEVEAVEANAVRIGDEEGIGEAPDVVFAGAMDARARSWDEDKPHQAALSYAIEHEMLPEIAGRYRKLFDDPEKGARAKKKVDGIVIAATQLMLATKTPPREKVPWTVDGERRGRDGARDLVPRVQAVRASLSRRSRETRGRDARRASSPRSCRVGRRCPCPRGRRRCRGRRSCARSGDRATR